MDADLISQTLMNTYVMDAIRKIDNAVMREDRVRTLMYDDGELTLAGWDALTAIRQAMINYAEVA